MVNTLRIASIAAVILAGLVLASVMGFVSLKVFGTRNDEELSRILSAPSVVDKFQESQGDKARSRQDAISPLVQAAETFAGIINPAPDPVGPTQPRPGPKGPPRPNPPDGISAKFDLLGTSYSPASPEDCFAYIRLQDRKTYRWVRKGDEIGHLLVKEIRRDSIICWDGQSDVPMPVPERLDTSSMLEGPVGSAVASPGGILPSAADRITGPSRPRPSLAPRPLDGTVEVAPPMTEEERAAREELVEKLKQSGVGTEEREALMNKLREELLSSRVSPEEAEKVEDLGRELDDSRNVSPIQGRTGSRRRLGSLR